jgi:hypothetical protein
VIVVGIIILPADYVSFVVNANAFAEGYAGETRV